MIAFKDNPFSRGWNRSMCFTRVIDEKEDLCDKQQALRDKKANYPSVSNKTYQKISH